MGAWPASDARRRIPNVQGQHARVLSLKDIVAYAHNAMFGSPGCGTKSPRAPSTLTRSQ